MFRWLTAFGAGMFACCFLGIWQLWPFMQKAPVFKAPYLTEPTKSLMVYHLGHSLVGPDMPYMLAQLAPVGHRWHVQRGSGTSLKAHWEPKVPIVDFDIANASPVYREAKEAIRSGDYEAVILTEMVELKAALRYFDSANYFSRWADLARSAKPKPRIYLYETWHSLDTQAGWLSRIDNDLETLWLGGVLRIDMERHPHDPVYLIPAGQVLAAVVREAEAGRIDGLTQREQLFERKADGSLDTIHINDLGSYIVALTHFSVLYHRSPEGLTHMVNRADGKATLSFSAKAAHQIQLIVWNVVTSFPRTGVRPTVNN